MEAFSNKQFFTEIANQNYDKVLMETEHGYY